jgi:hypothetical protein
MHGFAPRVTAAFAVLALAVPVGYTARAQEPVQARSAASPERSYTFAAAGDHGATSYTTEFLRRLDRSAARFYLALGDLDYDQTPTDRAWCRYVKRHLPRKGDRFPFEVEVGNHEEDGGPDGRIRHFTRCLPDRMDSNGTYGAQYAFTFPRRNPFAKVITIAPNLRVDGHTYRYTSGTAGRRWLVRQIDSARDRGIRWVIVGGHYPCLTTGVTHGCDSGTAVLNLLVRKRVDLMLFGHNHVYERSKQLRLGRTCPRLSPRRVDRGCIRDSGADGRYVKGRGTVQITAGAVAGREQGLDRGDPSEPYFTVLDGRSTGYVEYTVTPRSLAGRFVNTSGPLQDSFTIVAR